MPTTQAPLLCLEVMEGMQFIESMESKKPDFEGSLDVHTNSANKMCIHKIMLGWFYAVSNLVEWATLIFYNALIWSTNHLGLDRDKKEE